MMKVLIIDDSPIDRDLFKLWLGDNFDIIEASTANEGYQAIVEHKPNCVILDNVLPGESGYQFLYFLVGDSIKPPPIIFISGRMDESMKRNAKAHEAYACFEKSEITREKLLQTVLACVSRKAA